MVIHVFMRLRILSILTNPATPRRHSERVSHFNQLNDNDAHLPSISHQNRFVSTLLQNPCQSPIVVHPKKIQVLWIFHPLDSDDGAKTRCTIITVIGGTLFLKANFYLVFILSPRILDSKDFPLSTNRTKTNRFRCGQSVEKTSGDHIIAALKHSIHHYIIMLSHPRHCLRRHIIKI